MKSNEQLENELQTALKQLNELRQAHNVFLHKISHDLKTPSNEIVGSLAQLQETLTIDQLTFANQATQACIRLDQLLEQIVTLDELANQRAKLHRTEFDLNSLLNDHLTAAKARLDEHGKSTIVALRKNWEYPIDTLACVVGDREKLSKVLMALLMNAADHTSKGEISLTVRCLEESAGNIALEFVVSDTGPGIAKNRLENIFTPFSHYADYFHGPSKKIPLSLVICQQLSHLMHGSLAITSNVGQGTCVTLKLGFPLAKKSKFLRQANTLEPPVEALSTTKPILIVDDNGVNRNVLSAITRRLGFETKLAENGQIAVDIVKDQPLALIFMDCQMPVLNGFEATKAIRGFNPTIPIIAVTANTTDEDIQQCFKCGMDDVIAKPITPNKIGQSLTRWLAQDQQISKL